MEKLHGTCLLVVFLFSADIISTPVPGAIVPAAGEMVIMRHDMANDATTLVSNKPASTFPLTPAHWMGSSRPAGVSVKGNTLTVSPTDPGPYCIFTLLKCATAADGYTVLIGNSHANAFACTGNVGAAAAPRASAEPIKYSIKYC